MENLVAVKPFKDKIAIIKGSFSQYSLKRAVKDLEMLPVEQIRGFLVETGALENLPQLREITEASLTLRGDEEYSGILAALEPEEIAGVINISPEIFNSEEFHLIQPQDYDDPSLWESISEEQCEEILQSKDQKIMNRLCRFESGWKLFKRDVVILPEAVLGYLSAIYHAERDEEWKEAAARAIGIELLAYGAQFYREIGEMLQDISLSLANEVSTAKRRRNLQKAACAKFYEAHESAEEVIPIADLPETVKGDIEKLEASLRSRL